MRSLQTRAEVDQFLVDWAAALRSGEYLQTAGYLRISHPFGSTDGSPGYCCLGVACELLKLESVKLSDANVTYYKAGPLKLYGAEEGDFEGFELESELDLPQPILFAIERFYPGLLTGAIQGTPGTGMEIGDSFAHLNDSRDFDFYQIAAVIEARHEFLKEASGVANQG